jgi:hypothetical protein
MAPGQSIDKTMAQKSYVMSDPNMLDMLTVMHKTLGVTIAAARSDPANPPNVSGAELMTAPIVRFNFNYNYIRTSPLNYFRPLPLFFSPLHIHTGFLF